MKRFFFSIVFICSVILSGCYSGRRAGTLSEKRPVAGLSSADFAESISPLAIQVQKDTVSFSSDNSFISGGRQYTLMKAYRESDGEMVAEDSISASVITDKARNIAERGGKAVISFDITVPPTMQDPEWQCRFYPRLHVLDTILELDAIFMTGEKYRKAQLRGYELYNKYLNSIIPDDVDFLDAYTWRHLLEAFIERNLPQVWELRSDSTFFDEGSEASIFNVTVTDAVDYYAKGWKIRRNNRRKENIDRMYNRYVKSPIITEGVRLDTVISADNGDKIYRYVQELNVLPGMKRADLYLNGEIVKIGKTIYTMDECGPLTWYISSLAAFADTTLHFIPMIIHRDVNTVATSKISFELGKSEILLSFDENAVELERTAALLKEVLEDSRFVADSVTISASCSPEGSYAFNSRLASARSKSLVRALQKMVDTMDVVRSLEFGDEDGFKFCIGDISEDWDMLRHLVSSDGGLSESARQEALECWTIEDPDRREKALRERCGNYSYISKWLYPQLRRVIFNFHLHRKGMIQDTIHSSILDTAYMEGVKALKELDYVTAARLIGERNDINSAVAFLSLGYDTRAKMVLSALPGTPSRNYLLAIALMRLGERKEASEHLRKAIAEDPKLRFRCNLDPELTSIIEEYSEKE